VASSLQPSVLSIQHKNFFTAKDAKDAKGAKMGQNSKIEWLKFFGEGGHSWNPLRSRLKADLNFDGKIIPAGTVGWSCVKNSPECAGCYAETQNVVCGTNPGRAGNGVPYAADKINLVEIFLDEKTVEQPLRWKKPAAIFPCSMTDLFGEFVPEEYITRVYDVMEAAHWHTFLVLTKRPHRRFQFLMQRYGGHGGRKPAPNIWEGTSAGTVKTASAFIAATLRTPAALKWLSAEPLLETLNLTHLPMPDAISENVTLNALTGDTYASGKRNGFFCGGGLSWVVIGGESGREPRPCNVRNVISLVNQCKEAKVPAFVKQLGRRPCMPSCASVECTHPDCDPGWMKLRDTKGGDMEEWPAYLRVREFPKLTMEAAQ
jgi:protein gp37